MNVLRDRYYVERYPPTHSSWMSIFVVRDHGHMWLSAVCASYANRVSSQVSENTAEDACASRLKALEYFLTAPAYWASQTEWGHGQHQANTRNNHSGLGRCSDQHT